MSHSEPKDAWAGCGCALLFVAAIPIAIDSGPAIWLRRTVWSGLTSLAQWLYAMLAGPPDQSDLLGVLMPDARCAAATPLSAKPR